MKMFLAIDAQALNLTQDQLKKLRIGLKNKDIEHRFISDDQLHIPLVNLEDMELEAYEEREAYIHNVIQGHENFDLKLSGMWAYPNQHEGRLLWIGVQNSKELRSMQEDLSMQILGAEEFDFNPYLPVVRLRNHHNVSDLISPYKSADFGKLRVESVVLYARMTGGAFPVLKLLKRYYLSNMDVLDRANFFSA